jgi:stage II sporulation protein R
VSGDEIMKLKTLEISLIIGVLCAIGFGAWAEAAQENLSEKLVRLHVVANSDGERDQELKLKVRDKILEAAAPLLQGTQSADEAAAVLNSCLPFLEEQARLELAALGHDMPVRAELAREDFPTRYYEDFGLPAGNYQALRVTIGEGEGQNWWCVVFPPLCGSGNAAEAARAAGLTDGEARLIAEGNGVKIKFKSIEIWQKIRNML